jgi:glycosyltransferase involved in cell wall biosynthesis
MDMKKISVVVPVYNEEGNIRIISDAIFKALHSFTSKYIIDVLFVNDGSSDGTEVEIRNLSARDSRVRAIHFTRNFGKEQALTAGIINSGGDAVITIDADGQQPPEIISQFIEKWEKGIPVVVAIRKSHKGENFLKRAGSYVFYKVMSFAGDTNIMAYSTDFRLIDRRVVESFRSFGEQNRMTRGLIDWLGYKTEYVKYDSNLRKRGHAGYSYAKLIKLALTSIATHSLLPLKIVGYLGFIMTGFSFIFGSFVVVTRYVFPSNWALSLTDAGMLSILVIFLVSLILSCLGLMALYIGNIQIESLKRPHFIIREKVNFK